MPRWARLIVALAAAKVGLGMALYLSGLGYPNPAALVPGWVNAALSIMLGVIGALLVIGHRQDARAAWLGGILLLTAAPLAPMVNVVSAETALPVAYLRPEAMLPLFLWRFVAEFPTPLKGTGATAVSTMTMVATVLGAGCAIANTALLWLPPSGALQWFQVQGGYWLVIFGLTLPAFPALVWRAHTAPEEAQARSRLFVRSLLIGVVPFVLEVVAEELWPAYKRFAATPPARTVVATILFGCLATVPLVTAYSVLFDRVVEVRVVIRAALQHALARYAILGLTTIPFAALAVFLYAHRTEPLVSLMTGPRPLLLAGAVVIGIFALRLRDRWLAEIDRRYFREPYDAQQVLTRFVGDLRADSLEDLADRIRLEIERALHADADVLFANDARSALRDPGGRLAPLSTTATLVELALNDPRPMDVDLDDAASPLRRLPEGEKRWLAHGHYRLVVGLRSGAGPIAGLLVLSAKRSGLVYSSVDRHLLTAVAVAAGLAIDNLRLRSTPQSPSEPAAQECLECSRLNPADAARCACGGPVAEATAPHVLRGVFRMEQRIGAGGMGVVYRAVDLNLGRDVAIKTLPRVGVDQAARLRKEARAMAAVTHPNLAVVFGIETWQGIPFLVEEYLAGGTLAHRLQVSRLPVAEVLHLGVTLAAVLEQLHAGGILHCDIKPSNLGFTQRGVVKLLDFGLARLLRDTRAPSDLPTTQARRYVPQPEAASVSGRFVGTPHYMSPETINGDRPTPAVDVWALSVVLFEALAGRRPFEGDDSHRIFEQVTAARRPDLEAMLPDCPPALGRWFGRALAVPLAARPPDAAALRLELSSLAGNPGMS